MKLPKATLLVVLALQGAPSLSLAQGAFVNLDFESTTLSPDGPPGSVPISSGLPGWSAVIGGTPQSTILYNNGTLGTSAIALLGGGNSLTPVIDGKFSVMIEAGASPGGGGGTMANVSLSQTGIVPADARSILFKAYYQGPGAEALSVAINGQNLGVVALGAGGTLFGADVTGFSGQQGSLTFTLASASDALRIGVLDSISFSASPIPEPGIVALGALGLGLLGWFGRRSTRP
jgi:hypothetical protein